MRVYQKQAKLKLAYERYVFGKQSLSQLSDAFGLSIRTLQRKFDELVIEPVYPPVASTPVNLIVDATFFSRTDGLLVFRANQKNLYWQFIKTETTHAVEEGLAVLDTMGYQFKSVTLDGKKGMIKLFKSRYPSIPIQFCQFHQAQIIRRYTTQNPKTDCGQTLKAIMACLTQTNQEVFQSLVETAREQYDDFLKERNDNGQFMHRKLRSAFRSLNTNMIYLFTYKNFHELNIPNTTNSCDGYFAHFKQKLNIHRGLKKHRRNKMIHCLLSKQ